MTEVSRTRAPAGPRGAEAPRDRPGLAERTAPANGPRPDERRFQYCPVQCAECGAVVQAAKFSEQHTSVQWDATAVRRCAEFSRAAAASDETALIERCDAMRASIQAAVRAGRLPVVPP